MAIGDILGDIKSTGADLTPEQWAARQATLSQGAGQSSLANYPVTSPPAGPIGRAQQQLPSAGLGSANLGVPGQDDTKQTSFDISNTPAKYLSPGVQPGAAVQPVAPQQQPVSSLTHVNLGLSTEGDARQTSFDATNTPPQYLPRTAQPSQDTQPPAAGNPPGATGLGQINLTPFDPASAAQQPASLTDAFKTAPAAQPVAFPPSVAAPLAPSTPARLNQELPSDSTERSVSSGTVVRNDPQVAPPTQSGGLGQINVTPFDPVAAAQQPTSLTDAHLRFPEAQPQTDAPATPQTPPPAANPAQANPSPIAQTSAPVDASPPTGSLSLDQYRSTGAGTDASGANRQGGQIVAKVGPNGETSFSNATGDQTAAQSLGNLSVEPRVQTASARPSSLADLGSASNLGDGIGTFSQAQSGDAALAMGRFQKAHDLRESYKNQDRLSQALGAQWSADHTNIIHDSSKPLTLAQKQSDAGLDQTREQAANKVSLSQGLINSSLQNRSGEQQLRQASRLEDLQAAAIAPNATPEAVGAYSRAVDPTGEKGLARQLTQANIDEKNASAAAKLRNTSKIGNLPVGLQKLEDGDIDAVGNVQSINTQMGNILGQIDGGSLVLGPIENRKNAALNAAGRSTPQSANYASFMASLEKIRNDSLRLNKGPQTEGDANRAWNELLTNVNDPKVVKQRLGEIQAMNNKAAQVRLGMINSRRKNQGVGPLNVEDILGAPPQTSQSAQPQQAGATTSNPAPQAAQGAAAQSSVIPQIQNDDDFNNLPSGAQFIDPKGNQRRKP